MKNKPIIVEKTPIKIDIIPLHVQNEKWDYYYISCHRYVCFACSYFQFFVQKLSICRMNDTLGFRWYNHIKLVLNGLHSIKCIHTRPVLFGCDINKE